jgi:DNA-binding NtrC family response regulator
MHQASSKPHVICVDRDSLSQRLRREILQQAGYSITALNSLAEAEPYLKENHVALAVIDESALDADELRRVVAADTSLPVVILVGAPAVPAPSSRLQYFSKLDGPEAFLRTVRGCVKSG